VKGKNECKKQKEMCVEGENGFSIAEFIVEISQGGGQTPATAATPSPPGGAELADGGLDGIINPVNNGIIKSNSSTID
jgi:hypothetical protein